METRILNTLKNQESVCENMMVRLQKVLINYKQDKTFLYERAKLIGMIDLANSLEINTDEFSWIYNAI